MGLFSSVVHLREQRREPVLAALDAVLASEGFARTETLSVGEKGPYGSPGHREAISKGPCYLVSPLKGQWLTVIETHFALESMGVPRASELAIHLSGELQCYAFSLEVHDDDVLFYHLALEGDLLDSYDSCPQYFEQTRLTDEEVEQERHFPESFQAILPAGVGFDELNCLLNRGWWDSFHSGALDENGVAIGDRTGFAFEGDRMTALGTLLQLHGDTGEYPYAAWGEGRGINWSDFVAVRYEKIT